MLLNNQQLQAQSLEKLPEKLQAALFIKLLSMSKDINNGKDISIYVLNAPAEAVELKKAKGRMIGKSRLVSVQEGNRLPETHPTVIFIGDTPRFQEWIQFCQKEKILSISGIPELVEKGVTLGLSMVENKPLILLNITSSKAENISWHPTLLKLSKIYK